MAVKITHITATGTSFADAATITRNGKNMVVLVASTVFTDPRPGVIMPTSGEVGDYIEFHVDPASIDIATGGQAPDYAVYNEVGDIIAESGNSAFRRVETTNDHLTWASV
jgi:hypothetical protein